MLVYTSEDCSQKEYVDIKCFSVKKIILKHEVFVNLGKINLLFKHPCCKIKLLNCLLLTYIVSFSLTLSPSHLHCLLLTYE